MTDNLNRYTTTRGPAKRSHHGILATNDGQLIKGKTLKVSFWVQGRGKDPKTAVWLEKEKKTRENHEAFWMSWSWQKSVELWVVTRFLKTIEFCETGCSPGVSVYCMCCQRGAALMRHHERTNINQIIFSTCSTTGISMSCLLWIVNGMSRSKEKFICTLNSKSAHYLQRFSHQHICLCTLQTWYRIELVGVK